MISLFHCRNMSGVAFGSSASFRQLPPASTPKELCDFLGGQRVINKVISFFFKLI